MNKLIYRKLSSDIFAFFLLSSLALTSIVWVMQGVNLLDIITEKGHSISVYLIYTLLTLPKIFSKLLIFTYFLALFVVLNRYEENNEILVFWTNGIKKISFINFIAKFSLFFVFIQLLLNLIIVPKAQNSAQQYLKNSSMEFFPKLIEEKKFSNVMRNLTIFVEERSANGDMKGIYIKEQLGNQENKIIIANEGKIIQENDNFSFKLSNGKITNIDKKGNFNIGFKETTYELSQLNSKTRKYNKLKEANSLYLISCVEKFFEKRKDSNFRCIDENSFLIKNVYEEIFKRIVNPMYIIILSLVSSLIILGAKNNKIKSYYKFFLFFLGFIIILFSELSYKFLSSQVILEIFFIVLPLFLIIIFYITILIKTNFQLKYL